MKTSRSDAPPDPRRAALDSLLGRGAGSASGLSPRDSAFALRLRRETVVWRVRLDRALARFLRQPLDSLDGRTLAVLRLGAAQILVLGTPVHAAVSETVKLAGNPGARGLVNAVLRRLASEGEEDNLPPHVRWSHPEELVRRWTDRRGSGETEGLMKWNNEPPPLGGFAFGPPPAGRPGLYLEGYRIVDRGIPLPPPGVFLQDEAAAVAARAFRAIPGETALEICAAPGGKTAHQEGCFTVCMDLSFGRMRRWLENRERLRWEHAHPLVGDGRYPPLRGGFDKVFLDAPCTNTGVLRRRPGARWAWSVETLRRIARLQGELLEQAARLTSPGGAVFYSTCSLEPEENQDQVGRFEAAHPEFARIPLEVPASLEREGMMVSLPPASGVDGIFAAAWRRRG